MDEFIKWAISQLPSNATGAAVVVGLFLYAVKAQWIPLSVVWKNKKIIAPEERHYVTREHLMKNCHERQSVLDKKLDAQFKEVFQLLRGIDEKMGTAIKDMTARISEHSTAIAVLQERSSHHRKDD